MRFIGAVAAIRSGASRAVLSACSSFREIKQSRMGRTNQKRDTVEGRCSGGMRPDGESSSLALKAEGDKSIDAAAGRRCSRAAAAHTMCGGDPSSKNVEIEDATTEAGSRQI